MSFHARQLLRRGFTLIEVIVTISILGALGSVGSMLVMTSVGGFTASATGAQLHAEASISLDRIDRELRNIPRNDAAINPSPDISNVTANSITWQTDWSLVLSGTNLMFTEDGGTAHVLLSNVEEFSVVAFDESNAAMSNTLSGAACENIRRLRVTIGLRRSGILQTLRTKVFLRCMMINTGDGT